MASKAAKPNEAAENTAPENGTQAAASGKPPETRAESANETPPPDRKAPTYAYVGPSLPGGLLKANSILKGSLEEIKAYYGALLEGFPEIKYASLEKLIVPLARLAKSRENINKPGNIMRKYYSDIEGMVQEARKKFAGNGGGK